MIILENNFVSFEIYSLSLINSDNLISNSLVLLTYFLGWIKAPKSYFLKNPVK